MVRPHLAVAMRQQYDQMPTDHKRGVQDFVEFLVEERDPFPFLKVGTLCSGSDFPVMVLRRFNELLLDAYGKDIKLSHEFSCENVDWKIDFIRSNLSPKRLFNSLFEMKNRTAHDVITGCMQRVAFVDILLSGFECDDIASVNNKRKRNAMCCATGEGRTGGTLHGVLDFVIAHRPMIVILENVLNLAKKFDPKEQAAVIRSNLDYISRRLQQMGYVVAFHELHSSSHGVPHEKARIYITAFASEWARFDESDSLQASMKSCISHMKIDCPPLDMFLLPHDDPLVEQWLSGYTRKPEDLDKIQWMGDHKVRWKLEGVEWPGPQASNKLAHIVRHYEHTLTERERNLRDYLCFKMSRERVIASEVLRDLYMSISWGHSIEARCPGILPMSDIYLLVQRRLLTPPEGFKLIGWDLEAQGTTLIPQAALCRKRKKKQSDTWEPVRSWTYRQMFDLLGNAWCGYTFSIVLLVAISHARPTRSPV